MLGQVIHFQLGRLIGQGNVAHAGVAKESVSFRCVSVQLKY